jgi:IS1 family transposase
LGLIRERLALTQRSTIAITRSMRSCGYLMIDWFALREESARRR